MPRTCTSDHSGRRHADETEERLRQRVRDLTASVNELERQK